MAAPGRITSSEEKVMEFQFCLLCLRGWVGKNLHGFCWHGRDLEPDKQYLLGLESLARVQVRGKPTMCIPLVRPFGVGLRPRLLHSDILSASLSNATSCLAPISLLSFNSRVGDTRPPAVLGLVK